MMLRLLPLTVSIALAAVAPARAQGLLELYEAARAYDASWQSAKAQYDANIFRAEQARAGILPQAALSAGVTRSMLETNVTGAPVNPAVDRTFTTQQGTVSASQPLYRPANGRPTWPPGDRASARRNWPSTSCARPART
jgi:outer membrane protein